MSLAKIQDPDFDESDSQTPEDSEAPKGRLRLALEALLAREAREQGPEGEWRDGLWFPSPSERRPCCDGLIPTPANKQALESHCRSAVHVAALFDVPVLELRRALRRARYTKNESPSPAGASAPRTTMTNTERLARVSRAARSEAFQALRKDAQEGGGVLLKLSTLDEDASAEELSPLFETAGKVLERLVVNLGNAAQLEMVYRVSGMAAEKLRSLER